MTDKNSQKIKVCYVLCYKDPNYIRSRTLINALSEINNVDLIIVKNRFKSVLRYLEVPPKLFFARLRYQPTIFVVGFRAHEIFWAFYPSMIGKRVIFDEFINLHDWLINEHHKLRSGSWPAKLLDKYMNWVMAKSEYVLTDTIANAKFSSEMQAISLKKFIPLPVGTDESTFYPRKSVSDESFDVLFYGSMLPLHGTDIILETTKILAEKDVGKNINFTLVGGGNRFKGEIESFSAKHKIKSITYINWVDFEKLPDLIVKADLGLGGPFGDTGQAQRVVTGKTYQFLAMAKPVIVGRIEDMEGFENKRNCLLVEQGSPQALADVIKWASGHKTELAHIGEEGKKLFDKNFSTKVLAGQLWEIISKA
jgi:glycosyltransferase involved in cell wall biosynthesis